MMKQETLEDWLKPQTARGCKLESMIEAMQNGGYMDANGRSIVAEAFCKADTYATNPSPHLPTIAAWQQAAKNRHGMANIKPVISLNSRRLMMFEHLLSDV